MESKTIFKLNKESVKMFVNSLHDMNQDTRSYIGDVILLVGCGFALVVFVYGSFYYA